MAKSARSLWTEVIKSGKALGKAGPAEVLQAGSMPGAHTAFAGRVLGIDPSLRGTGLAVVSFQPRQEPQFLGSTTVKLPAKAGQPECLAAIHQAVTQLVTLHHPSVCAIEQTIYVQNFQTAQIMGLSRGAALAAAAVLDVGIFEYAPLRIKQAVTGVGRASKHQVAAMVQQLLHLATPLPFDESDACAVALCHAFTAR